MISFSNRDDDDDDDDSKGLDFITSNRFSLGAASTLPGVVSPSHLSVVGS